LRARHLRRRRLPQAFESLEGRRLFALSVTPFNPADGALAFANALVSGATGITVTSATFVGNDGQAGTFSGFDLASGPETLQLGDGVLLTSGMAANALGPNDLAAINHSWGAAGDADVDALLGSAGSNDANVLTIEFTADSATNSVTFDLIFGSDEFPEYVGAYNDAFGAFLDGAQVSFDGAGVPVTVNNNYFQLDNSGTSAPGKKPVTMDVEYDGLTPSLRTHAPIATNLSTHTLKFVIADVGDSSVDSGVFLAWVKGSPEVLTGPRTTVSAPTLQMSAAAQDVANTAGSATVTVTRTGDTSGAVDVSYATADGTGVAGTHYTASSGTLSFLAGETSKSIAVPVIDRPDAPASRTFTVTLSSPSPGANLTVAATHTVTVTNSQSAVTFAGGTQTVSNDDGSVTLTVNRSGNTANPATLSFATVDGTAVAGVDYTAASGTVEFAAGETTKTVVVPVVRNAGGQPTSTFTVVLSNPASGTAIAGHGEVVVTVENGHSVIEFEGGATTVPSREGTLSVLVRRRGNTSQPASVDYATVAGTAVDGVDYQGASGTVEFAPGETDKSIVINLIPVDGAPEPVTFDVVLSSAQGAGEIGTATLHVTVEHATLPVVTAEQLLSPRKKAGRLSGVTLTFDQPMEAAPQETAFALARRLRNRPDGTPRLKALKVQSVSYDATTQSVTLRTRKPLRGNRFYQLAVTGSNVRAQTGRALDGAGSGEEGSDLVLHFGRGRRIRYIDSDGDRVRVRLRGPGVLELSRREDGEGDVLTVVGPTAATTFFGSVAITGLGGDGTTTLADILGLDAGTDALDREQFIVGMVG
jgi:hypothetical protein